MHQQKFGSTLYYYGPTMEHILKMNHDIEILIEDESTVRLCGSQR